MVGNKIAILSGKGGTGKTFVSVNLANVAKPSVYCDCDVEEPNGHLFFQPENIKIDKVYTTIPVIDEKLCNGCRKCVDFCRFHALLYLKHKPLVFKESCHACGGCAMVCPQHAITEEKREIGHIEMGVSNHVNVISGILNLGEVSGVPIIHKIYEKAEIFGQTIFVDCPPGSDCSVIESVTDADCCVIVVEQTLFGFHNFKMVHELVSELDKPCCVIINKYECPFPPIEEYCKQYHIPIIARLPFDKDIANLTSQGIIASEVIPHVRETFLDIYQKIGECMQ